MLLDLKYGHNQSIRLEVPDENLLGILRPNDGALAPLQDIGQQVLSQSKPIEELVSKDDTVAIIVDDYTRPVPNAMLLKPLLGRLAECGLRNENISIVIASGTHRPPTKGELQSSLGAEICNNAYKLILHDCNASDLAYYGKTERGTPVYINKVVAQSKKRIVVCDTNLHYYAGYGGGRKSILPGVSGDESIQHNHKLMFDPHANTGELLNNPVSIDMTEAAEMVGIDFVINVVQDAKKRVVAMFAGKPTQAFEQGVKLVDSLYKLKVKEPADVLYLSSGGYPSDINLYQALKAIDQSLDAVRAGGSIVWFAACDEGVGHTKFEEYMESYRAQEEVETQLKKRFELGGHKAWYLYKALRKADIYIVSNMAQRVLEQIYQLKPLRNANNATKDEARGTPPAYFHELMVRKYGPDYKAYVIESGNSTLVTL